MEANEITFNIKHVQLSSFFNCTSGFSIERHVESWQCFCHFLWVRLTKQSDEWCDNIKNLLKQTIIRSVCCIKIQSRIVERIIKRHKSTVNKKCLIEQKKRQNFFSSFNSDFAMRGSFCPQETYTFRSFLLFQFFVNWNCFKTHKYFN